MIYFSSKQTQFLRTQISLSLLIHARGSNNLDQKSCLLSREEDLGLAQCRCHATLDCQILDCVACSSVLCQTTAILFLLNIDSS